jgi:translation initiation factor 1 (eIF-1/SUI1)
MIDLFESIIKTHTVVILGEYFKQNKYSNAAKGLLASGLRTPSLGTWQLFSRVLYKELAAENHIFFQADFAKEFEKLDKDLDNQKTNVISFRNEYAHGATPSDELCSLDIKRFEPFLESLLASKWLADSTLLDLEGKVSISNSSNADVISLYPILLFKPEPNSQPYVFFNDLKNDKVGLLNYPLSKHYREKDFFQEFNAYLPLKEWKKTGTSEFHQRIEELTETFKGRTQERLGIKEFIEKKDRGYFSIQGNPGIGKSALIAQLFKDLSNQTPKLPIKLVEYFIRRGTAQANSTYLLNYLLKATDTHFSEGKNIQAEGKTNWDLQQQLFAKWRAYGDANPKEKMVFFIDGLDEGVENDILRYLPRENFKDILVIYGSRPGGHKDIETFWTELPIENHQPLLLTGLSKNDIRALLYEVGNKYEIEKDSAWIDTVEKRSEGNPLYLKLLCNAIENGSIPYNDPKALPTEINDYYKAILARYANDSQDGDALLSSLFVFAAAFDYLTLVHLQLINGFGAAQSIRIESTLKEVLYENPLTEEVLDYQLFHESFREFLIQFYPTELKRAETKLLEFCSTWNTLQHTFEQRYALQYYTSHLTQSSTEQSILTLLNLSKDKAYTDTQKKVLRDFVATKQLYQEIIHHTIKTASTDEALEAALALVDLKYEEQNDAATILAMVANNEIDLALQRITSFGGESKEDKQRQFILYMLCFMELTLLESKTQPWRKLAIEKLMAQFEEQIPIDHSLVNWNDFFPSYLMFLMACEWAEMGLDYLIAYKRTNYWQVDWINIKSPYTDSHFRVLLECVMCISDDFFKSLALDAISNELINQSKYKEALAYASDIIDDYWKSLALATISTELAKQDIVEEAAKAMQEALACASDIIDDYWKTLALATISTELAKQDIVGEAALSMQEAHTYASEISDDYWKTLAHASISTELVKQGITDGAATAMQKSLDCSRGISNDYSKIKALVAISNNLAKQVKQEEAESAMQEALACVGGISDNFNKSLALNAISNELAKQGNVDKASSALQEAFACARRINDNKNKSSTLTAISNLLAKQGNVDEAALVLQEAHACAKYISDESDKIQALASIFTELAKQGNVEEAALALQEALAYARGISDDYWKTRALYSISTELVKLVKNEEIISALQEVLSCALGISHYYDKSLALNDISTELTKRGMQEEALSYARRINDNKNKSSTLTAISNLLAKQGNVDEAALAMQESLACASNIIDDYDKIKALSAISTELAKQLKHEEAESAMQEAIACARATSDDIFLDFMLSDISNELAMQSKVEEAFACIQDISYDRYKSEALVTISTVMARHGKVNEAFACIKDISYDRYKSRALATISTEQVKLGKTDEAESAMEEALAYARGINDDFDGMALADISAELAKQGNWTIAERIGMEIPQIADRHNCWKTIAKDCFEQKGWQKALQHINQLKNHESRLFYLKGWADGVMVSDATIELVTEALPYFVNDTESIEKILQQHALHEVVFNAAPQAKIKQLNSTLNIQWFLDIHNSLPQSPTATRLSTNLDAWLHEIEDEDDQDQITLWAKQVAKGKITEEEFRAKIKEIE